MRFTLHGSITRRVISTIGVWDPLSYNHINLFNYLIERSKLSKLDTCIILIHPKPVDLINNNDKSFYYNDIIYIINKIIDLGINGVLEIKFNKQSDILKNAMNFIPSVLKYINLKKLFIGNSQTLGRGPNGNKNTIRALGEKYGFTVEEIPSSIFTFKAKRLNENNKFLQLISGGFSFNKNILPFPPTIFIKNKKLLYLNFKNGQYQVGFRKAIGSVLTHRIDATIKNGILNLDTYTGILYDWIVIVRGP